MKKTLLILIIILALLTGCAPTVTIEDINSDEASYLGKDVAVSGRVIAPMGFGMVSGFTLQDGDSSILVSSSQLPAAGNEVTVEGVVVKGVFTGTFIYAKRIR